MTRRRWGLDKRFSELGLEAGARLSGDITITSARIGGARIVTPHHQVIQTWDTQFMTHCLSAGPIHMRTLTLLQILHLSLHQKNLLLRGHLVKWSRRKILLRDWLVRLKSKLTSLAQFKKRSWLPRFQPKLWSLLSRSKWLKQTSQSYLLALCVTLRSKLLAWSNEFIAVSSCSKEWLFTDSLKVSYLAVNTTIIGSQEQSRYLASTW